MGTEPVAECAALHMRTADMQDTHVRSAGAQQGIQLAEEKAAPVFEVCPESKLVSCFEEFADSIISICGGE